MIQPWPVRNSGVRSLVSLGEIMLLAFVPDDWDRAIAHGLQFGAGPFFILRNARFRDFAYAVDPVDLVLTVAFGYWGDMQIEIMRQENPAPSGYSRWRKADREGVHHVCVMVDDITDACAACAAAGIPILLDAEPPSGGRVFYTEPAPGEPLVEFITGTSERRAFYAMMRDAHRDWDGSDPVRTICK